MGELKDPVSRPNKGFLKEKTVRDNIKTEVKKDVSPELEAILDETDRHEDRVEILLLEILRALKPKT